MLGLSSNESGVVLGAYVVDVHQYETITEGVQSNFPGKVFLKFGRRRTSSSGQPWSRPRRPVSPSSASKRSPRAGVGKHTIYRRWPASPRIG
jgi:hypothetical protein